MGRLTKKQEADIRRWTQQWTRNELKWSDWRDHILGLGLDLEDPATNALIEKVIHEAQRGRSLGQRLKERWYVLVAGFLAMAFVVLLALSLVKLNQVAKQQWQMVQRQEEIAQFIGEHGATLKALAQQAKSPAKVELSATRQDLPADGQSSAIITLAVYDQLGQPVQAGTELSFTIMPPDDGTISTPTYTGEDGKATTSFIAGKKTGAVTVTATAGSASSSITFKLTEPPKPVLAMGLSVLPQELRAGDILTVTVLITNTGTGPANNFSVWCNIPQETKYQAAYPDLALTSTDQISWSVGNLGIGSTWRGTFSLKVNEGVSAITIGSNACSIKMGQETMASVPKQAVTVNVLSPLTVTLSPAVLLATGTPFTVTAYLTDPQGSALAGGTSVHFDVAPTDLCVITGTTDVPVSNGSAAVVLQPGNKVGTVRVTAKTESAIGEATLEITTTAVVSEQLSLWSSTQDSKQIIISIPTGAAVTLLGESSGDYQKVLMVVWVPKECVESQDTQGQQKSTLKGCSNGQVMVGDTPKQPAGTLTQTAAGYQLRAVGKGVQEDNVNWLLVEIEGWMKLYYEGRLQLKPAVPE